LPECSPSDAFVLSDGTRLCLRPLGAEDRAMLAELFARLSEESRYRRYLTGKPELTPRDLTYLTDVDHVVHEAFAAVDERDGSIVGVSRYVEHPPGAGTAEVAVEVADELHRKGIGGALTRRVIDRARANGIVHLTATTLRENQPARALLRSLGFRAQASSGGQIEFELPLRLAAAA
jgi:RimJ/RimL family protein N-acetyltransferase